ncbi:hypothetical protein FW774_03290 (plasmid) [Pedobacter sp. BS3]|uniref:chaperone modulator CbpM n=1 Tax=Pedobacter sp. BS3 TaxID=2567937 RepID=UPI0011EFB6D6|nr:chaperone modulator CbpM [Pedobacter sp. BS3]TZF86094.1 hypothetical protein FW774_03290 [Pedobacter sp. BS3]
METSNLILVSEFCTHHHIDVSFISILEQSGLIQTKIIRKTAYLPHEQLNRVERLVRLHQDLDIQADDLDVVAGLLDRMENLQQQVTELKNRLSFYERLEG